MTDWHPGPDQLAALALAELDQPEQERLLAHLAACPACHATYAEVSDGMQQALVAAPAVAPPAGFSGRVLAAMTAGGVESVRPRPRARLLVAAAVLLGLLAGIGGTLAVTWLAARAPGAANHQPVATQLRTGKGDAVGSAGIATLGGRAYLVLSITSGRPGASYECVLVGTDGRRTSGGTWRLDSEYGSEVGTGSWLVPLSGEPPARVELIAPSGNVWSRGEF